MIIRTDNLYIQASTEAMKEVFGKDTVFVRSGGSIPIVGDFDKHLGIPSVMMGFGLPDDNLLFRTLWDLGALERKLGADQQAISVWEDLAAARNPFRLPALEELAKHYEHRQKDPARALETTRTALAHEDTPALRRREERLIQRLEARRTASRSTVKRRRLL